MPSVVAVTSGKGGVGKSCIALNLAIAVARHGRRTLLVDADFGLGSSALLMGSAPEYNLEDVLLGHSKAAEAAIPGPEGLQVLASASDGGNAGWDLGIGVEEVRVDLSGFEANFEMIVVDTGAGLASKTVDSAAAAERILLVATPEPAAIADAYATMKSLLGRSMALEIHLLVNMAESRREAEDLQEKFAELAIRFIGAQIDNRGYIPLDRYVREAAKRQMPFAQMDPPSPAADAVEELARYFGGMPVSNESPGFFNQVLGWRDAGSD
ncbi:MAG: P-loop NTPase [Candidatus Latescibacterota bacterium]|jgi:flagellar biosynthesis protein FlhG